MKSYIMQSYSRFSSLTIKKNCILLQLSCNSGCNQGSAWGVRYYYKHASSFDLCSISKYKRCRKTPKSTVVFTLHTDSCRFSWVRQISSYYVCYAVRDFILRRCSTNKSSDFMCVRSIQQPTVGSQGKGLLLSSSHGNLPRFNDCRPEKWGVRKREQEFETGFVLFHWARQSALGEGAEVRGAIFAICHMC